MRLRRMLHAATAGKAVTETELNSASTHSHLSQRAPASDCVVRSIQSSIFVVSSGVVSPPTNSNLFQSSIFILASLHLRIHSHLHAGSCRAALVDRCSRCSVSKATTAAAARCRSCSCSKMLLMLEHVLPTTSLVSAQKVISALRSQLMWRWC